MKRAPTRSSIQSAAADEKNPPLSPLSLRSSSVSLKPTWTDVSALPLESAAAKMSSSRRTVTVVEEAYFMQSEAEPKTSSTFTASPEDRRRLQQEREQKLQQQRQKVAADTATTENPFLIDVFDATATLEALQTSWDEDILEASLKPDRGGSPVSPNSPLNASATSCTMPSTRLRLEELVDWDTVFKRNHPSLPWSRYSNPVVEAGFVEFVYQNHRIPVVAQLCCGVLGIVFGFVLRPDYFQNAGLWSIVGGFLNGVMGLVQILMGLGPMLKRTTRRTRCIVSELQLFVGGGACFFGLGILYWGTAHSCALNTQLTIRQCTERTPLGLVTLVATFALVGPRFVGFVLIAILGVLGLLLGLQSSEGLAANFTAAYVLNGSIIIAHIFAMCGIRAVREHLARQAYESHLPVFAERRVAERTVEDVNEALEHMLPPTVLPRLVKNEAPHDLEVATVLQSDICNFTSWCSTRSPVEVVQMLSTVVSEFDALAMSEEVVRVKSMGDGYLAISGLPVKKADHADAVLRFAMGILEVLRSLSGTHKHTWGELEVRVGVHSGYVMGAMLSRQRWAYDIYGQVPKGAATLEHNCPVGGVLLSQATYDQLSVDWMSELHHYTFESSESADEETVNCWVYTRDKAKFEKVVPIPQLSRQSMNTSLISGHEEFFLPGEGTSRAKDFLWNYSLRSPLGSQAQSPQKGSPQKHDVLSDSNNSLRHLEACSSEASGDSRSERRSPSPAGDGSSQKTFSPTVPVLEGPSTFFNPLDLQEASVNRGAGLSHSSTSTAVFQQNARNAAVLDVSSTSDPLPLAVQVAKTSTLIVQEPLTHHPVSPRTQRPDQVLAAQTSSGPPPTSPKYAKLTHLRNVAGPSLLFLNGTLTLLVVSTKLSPDWPSMLSPSFLVSLLFAVSSWVNLLCVPSKYVARSTCLVTAIFATPVIVVQSQWLTDSATTGTWLAMPLLVTLVPMGFFVPTLLILLVGVVVISFLNSQPLGKVLIFLCILVLILLAQVTQQQDWHMFKSTLRDMLILLSVTDSEILLLERLLHLKIPAYMIQPLLDQRRIDAITKHASYAVGAKGHHHAVMMSRATLDTSSLAHANRQAVVAFVQFTSAAGALGAVKSTITSAPNAPLRHRGAAKALRAQQTMVSMVDDLLPSLGGTLLQKVKTVGDSVLIAGALGPSDATAHDVGIECLGLLQTFQDLLVANHVKESPIEASVGIAVGPVIAAVIGKQQLEFDVFGTTVNKAARIMASIPTPDPHHKIAPARQNSYQQNAPKRLVLASPPPQEASPPPPRVAPESILSIRVSEEFACLMHLCATAKYQTSFGDQSPRAMQSPRPEGSHSSQGPSLPSALPSDLGGSDVSLMRPEDQVAPPASNPNLFMLAPLRPNGGSFDCLYSAQTSEAGQGESWSPQISPRHSNIHNLLVHPVAAQTVNACSELFMIKAKGLGPIGVRSLSLRPGAVASQDAAPSM